MWKQTEGLIEWSEENISATVPELRMYVPGGLRDLQFSPRSKTIWISLLAEDSHLGKKKEGHPEEMSSPKIHALARGLGWEL